MSLQHTEEAQEREKDVPPFITMSSQCSMLLTEHFRAAL